ncbi:hypothetical protein [Gracilibacillus sp. YIM 98692]|uniref:hypothetical protein n=1 Tax=Gracilibacillus sp. YIM 98692 TaxID=2663532 RepID=UPI0013D7ECC8|nr:hypothetical protein [Gracilibacillus sp. YIM 98692]
MRINENFQADHEAYSNELKERVTNVFQYTSQMIKLKKLLSQMKKESENIRTLFITEEELMEKRHALNLFDSRMQATVYYTLKNIENYQMQDWKKLFDEGE